MDNIIYEPDWNMKQQLNEPLQEPVPFEEFQFSFDLNIPAIPFPEDNNNMFLEPPQPPPFLPMDTSIMDGSHEHHDDINDMAPGGSILDDSDRKAFNQFLDTFFVDPNMQPSMSLFEAPPSLYLDQPLPTFDNLSIKDQANHTIYHEHQQQHQHQHQQQQQHESSKSSPTSNSSSGGGPVRRTKLHKELLTEEEKRNRHISSEHRRRDMIRSGFENLSDLLPALQNNSRSTILFKAADYIKCLEKRNRHLRKKIKMLQLRVEASKLYRY
ncbi:hypothetical protein K501DRAFT_266178 [Backusella circina FSU 941]|nr:hypothetical protein K501DRAFT_266178 [Backusella circina FSU 941]